MIYACVHFPTALYIPATLAPSRGSSLASCPTNSGPASTSTSTTTPRAATTMTTQLKRKRRRRSATLASHSSSSSLLLSQEERRATAIPSTSTRNTRMGVLLMSNTEGEGDENSGEINSAPAPVDAELSDPDPAASTAGATADGSGGQAEAATGDPAARASLKQKLLRKGMHEGASLVRLVYAVARTKRERARTGGRGYNHVCCSHAGKEIFTCCINTPVAHFSLGAHSSGVR